MPAIRALLKSPYTDHQALLMVVSVDVDDSSGNPCCAQSNGATPG